MSVKTTDEYKETATLDQDGKVLSLECDGVSMPAGYGFAAVNDWVHDTGRHFEELQWHALGAANAYDQLQVKADAVDDLVATFEARLEELEREHCKDKARLDWLGDPDNAIGNVQLPTECVMQNMGSLRDAIDAAMLLPR